MYWLFCWASFAGKRELVGKAHIRVGAIHVWRDACEKFNEFQGI
jgi:hypothetical protein